MKNIKLRSQNGLYRIEREYARGGMGVTYLVVREPSGERCILKQLRLENVSDWKVVQLFEREAEILRQLNHPNIPAYIDYFLSESNKHFNLIQAFIEGQTVLEWIDKHLPVSRDQFIRFLEQSLDILIYLHGLVPPVIHRDITPKNLILQKDRIYLVDFGSVKDAVNPSSGRGSTVVGTFGYMPPEQYLGHAEPGSDLYSLGMSFIAFAAHKDPFQMVNPELGQVQIKNELDALPAHVKSLLLEMTEPALPKRLKSASSAKQKLLHPETKTAPSLVQSVSGADQAEMDKSKAALWIFIFLFSVMGLIAFFYSVSNRNYNEVAVREAPKQSDLDIREQGAIQCYAVSRSGKWIASGLRDQLVIRNAETGDLINRIGFDTIGPVKNRPELILGGKMFFTHDDRRLVIIGNLKNRAYWWNTDNWRLAADSPLPEGTLLCAVPSVEQTFVSAWRLKNQSGCAVIRCRENKWEILHQLDMSDEVICAIDSIPRIIAFAGKSDTLLTVYDTEIKDVIRIMPLPEPVRFLQLDHSGKRLAWMTDNQWTVQEVHVVQNLISGQNESNSGATDPGQQIHLSSDGRWLALYRQSYFRPSLYVYSTDNRQIADEFYPDDSGIAFLFRPYNHLQIHSLRKQISLLNFDRIMIWYFHENMMKLPMSNHLAAILNKPGSLIAVVGATDNQSKFGSIIYRSLKQNGYRVIPLNPARDKVDGDRCYESVSEVPDSPDLINFVTPPEVTLNVLNDCLRNDLLNVWIQPGASDARVSRFLREHPFHWVDGDCIMMYFQKK